MSRLEDFQVFDFTNVDESGFTIVEEGRYICELSEVYGRVKEDTGNFVMDMDFTIDSGKYEGQNLRHFQTLKPDPTDTTWGFMLSTLSRLGVIHQGDRGPNGELKVKLDFGEKDDNGRVHIPAVYVGEERRELAGKKAVLVVTVGTDNNGRRRNNVERVETPESAEEAQSSSQPQSQIQGKNEQQNTQRGMPF